MNEQLQEKLNPPASDKPERLLFGALFRLGDKVMQTRNNYDKDVYNGDIGFIRVLDLIEQTLTVDFDGRAVTYDWLDADRHAALHDAATQPAPHTITRARRLCVLCGSRRAIGIAVRNNKMGQRFTALAWRLERPDKLPGSARQS